MKKILWLGSLSFIALFMYACKPSTSPSAVAIDFSKAWAQKDFTKLKTLVSKNDKDMLDAGEAYSKKDDAPDSLKSLIDAAVFKAANEKIENDTMASVDITTTLPREVDGTKESTETYILKKEGGQWKIDMAGTIRRAMESLGGVMPGMDNAADDAAMDSTEADTTK